MASLFVMLSASMLLFSFSKYRISILFGLSSDEMRSITSSVCFAYFFGLIASRKLIDARYSGDSTAKPISWMSDLRFVFVGEYIWSDGESMLKFTGFLCVVDSSMVFIGMGSPKAFAKAD